MDRMATYRLIIVFSVPDARPIDVSAVLSYNNEKSTISSLSLLSTPSPQKKRNLPYFSNSQSAPSAPVTPSTHPRPAPPSPALSADSPAVSVFRLRESRCRRGGERGRSRMARRRWGCQCVGRRGGRSWCSIDIGGVEEEEEVERGGWRRVISVWPVI